MKHESSCHLSALGISPVGVHPPVSHPISDAGQTARVDSFRVYPLDEARTWAECGAFPPRLRPSLFPSLFASLAGRRVGYTV